MTQSFGSLPVGRPPFVYHMWGWHHRRDLGFWGNPGAPAGAGSHGRAGDVALGFDTAGDYLKYGGCLGATVGRNANRVGGSCLNVGEKTVRLTPNEGPNNLHSGPDYWYHRMWMVDRAHGKRHHPGAGDAGWRPGFPRRGTGGSDLCADRRRSAHHLSGDL